jgi:hypothetical protein
VVGRREHGEDVVVVTKQPPDVPGVRVGDRLVLDVTGHPPRAGDLVVSDQHGTLRVGRHDGGASPARAVAELRRSGRDLGGRR